MSNFQRKQYEIKIAISFFACVFGLSLGIKSIAQNTKRCCATEMTQKFIDKNPHLLAEILKTRQKLEEHTRNFISNKNLNSATTIYVIPVVFHIIHDNGIENIPDAKVFDAMKILNYDFRKWNPDTDEVVSPFNSIIGNANIEFRLAQLDPWGNATNGIERIVSAETYIGDDGSKLNPWPRSKYLNIWVCAEAGGAAGWTYLPSSVNWSPDEDGIVIMASYVGNSNRTLTHETGHWINLLHPWGWSNNPGLSSNCSEDDGVSDTPNTIGVDDWSCNTNQVTCSSLDNVQNYMDYSICERMFTEGQVSRMRASLTSTTAQRNNLWTASNLSATGINNNAAVFSVDLTHICVGSSLSFYDQSYNGITSWEWSFPGGTPATSNLKLPTITYNTPGVYNVSLTVINASDSISVTKSSFITVMTSLTMPYSEEFDSGLDWEITNYDQGNTWEYTTGASYSGYGGSLKINNYSGNLKGEVDGALSPSIDLSVMQSAQISFKVAYAQKSSSSDDILKLYTSNNCGNLWTLKWIRDGSVLAGANGIQSAEFVPADTNAWQYHSVNISTFQAQNFRFKFEFICDEGNNLYIDNINISGIYKPIPILVSPPDYSTNQPVDVTIDWNAVTGINFYQYEVDTSILFSSSVLISGINTYFSSSNTGLDTEYQLSGLDFETTYYWRVRTITGTDTADWSTTWKFSITSNIPILISPPNYSTNQPINIMLVWNDIASVDYYQFEIDTSLLFSSTLLISDTTYDSDYLIINLDSGTIYYWKVRTITGTDTSDWSSIWKFTIVSTVGIDNVLSSNLNLMIYPNPVEDFLVISFNLEKPAQEFSFKIYDIIGREILTFVDTKSLGLKTETVRLATNFQDKKAGIYLIRFSINNQIFTRRFVNAN
ncbi:MAG: M43 family zinc metalloprotease [Bacteroidota bacterium]